MRHAREYETSTNKNQASKRNSYTRCSPSAHPRMVVIELPGHKPVWLARGYTRDVAEASVEATGS